RDQPNPIGRLRIAPEEVVLGEGSHHAIAAEQQRECLNDGGLAAVVGANKHRVLPEPDITCLDSAEILYAEIGNLHEDVSPRPRVCGAASFRQGGVLVPDNRTSGPASLAMCDSQNHAEGLGRYVAWKSEPIRPARLEASAPKFRGAVRGAPA